MLSIYDVFSIKKNKKESSISEHLYKSSCLIQGWVLPSKWIDLIQLLDGMARYPEWGKFSIWFQFDHLDHPADGIRGQIRADNPYWSQWKRLSVYYSQYLDRQITIDNSLLLTSDLTPIVALVNEKRSYLGDKYSNCTPE